MSHFKSLKCIAIDITAVTPGGDNGGSKVMTLELISRLSVLSPDCHFILLTHECSHKELEYLDNNNTRRLCVEKYSSDQNKSLAKRLIIKSFDIFGRKLLFSNNKSWSKFLFNLQFYPDATFLYKLNIDLLFCPFASFKPIRFYDQRIPVVSVIYDLQHVSYPQFFSSEEINGRDKCLKEISEHTTSVVCISNYTKATYIKNTKMSRENVYTIYIRLANRLKIEMDFIIQKKNLLEKFSLQDNQYMLYPANFWPHKNHDMLFNAFKLYLNQNPNSLLKLVCTGSEDKKMGTLKEKISHMGLSEFVIFTGHLSQKDFSIIMQSCRAVIFPSLYEGFGMPILEAMKLSKPVFCSNVTSMPEIAGNAAYLFDPSQPQEIVSAIEKIESDSVLLNNLIELGLKHVNDFNGDNKIEVEYWNVFLETVDNFYVTNQNTCSAHENGMQTFNAKCEHKLQKVSKKEYVNAN